MSRYLYVVGCVGVQAVKIGVATNCISRLAGLQVGCPFPLALLWSKAVPDARAAEQALHERFSRQRVRGEWFDLGLDPLSAVKGALKKDHLLDADDPRAPVVIPPDAGILTAALEVWPEYTHRITAGDMARLLAGHESGKYATWKPFQVAAQMRAAGFPPVPQRIDGQVTRGYDRIKIMQVMKWNQRQ